MAKKVTTPKKKVKPPVPPMMPMGAGGAMPFPPRKKGGPVKKGC